MKPSMRARIWGLLNSLDWNKEITRFKGIVEQEDALPLATAPLLSLLREMNEKGQRKMAQTLQLPFAQRNSKKWPELFFLKSMHSLLKQACHDVDSKRRLVLSVVQEVQPLLESSNDCLDTFVNEQPRFIAEFGCWHYYWAFYFHPGRKSAPQQWQACWKTVQETAVGWEQVLVTESQSLVPIHEEDQASNENDLCNKKIAAMERRLAKETGLRQKLNLELEQSKRLLLEKEKERKQAECQLTEQAKQIEHSERKEHEAIRQLEIEEQMRSKMESKWNTEKEKLREQIWSQKQEASKLNQQVEQLSKENRRLRASAAELQRIRRDPNGMIRILCDALDEEVRSISPDLTGEGQSGMNERERMRVILDLLDALEAYRHKEKGIPDTLTYLNPTQTELPSLPELFELDGTDDHTNDAYMGTFYRRDHGGYIQLESGEVFNITESMVNNHQLEHEAEVQCRPYTQDNGAIFYEVELLFQGDNLYAPIRQYVGYAQLGDHYTWYCVDLNDPNRRYPLHRKDVEIQQPEDGMPCTFNVAEEGEFARLSRIYRHFAKADAPSELNRIQAVKMRINDNTPSVKPKPFLNGCMIAIIGGQRKWFEDVVMESGAALVHDNGDRPERITADLRRSQVVFLLITATSHRATWEGIEIAKEYGIPHFIIQGSKSNLRKLLWDNRKAIKAGLH